jgi:hypothetical protein
MSILPFNDLAYSGVIIGKKINPIRKGVNEENPK